MGHLPPHGIRSDPDYLWIPQGLSQRTRSHPDLNVVGMLVRHLTPKSSLCSQDIVFVVVILHSGFEVQLVELVPVSVGPVRASQKVPHSHVQVVRPVVGDDYLVGGALGEPSSPPMDDILCLHLGDSPSLPVHWVLVGVDLLHYLLLSDSVDLLESEFVGVELLLELSSVGETGERHFISSEVNYWVDEDIVDLGEDIPQDIISLGYGHVKGTHVGSLVKSAGDFFVLRSFAPRSSMTGGIELGDNPDPSHQRIPHNLPRLIRCVCLILTESPILSDLWVLIQNQREGILIGNMPMQNAHLVVHQGIDCLDNQMQREKVPSCVDHDPSIGELWVIVDGDWEIRQGALL